MHYATSQPVQATLYLPPPSTIVLLIDPISTTCRIAQEISKRGHHIAALWTSAYTDNTPEHKEDRNPAKYGCSGLRYKFELQEGRDFVWNDAARNGQVLELEDSEEGEEENESSLDAIVDAVKEATRSCKLHIVGCIPGSGMARASHLADILAARLGLKTCLLPSSTSGDGGGSPTSAATSFFGTLTPGTSISTGTSSGTSSCTLSGTSTSP